MGRLLRMCVRLRLAMCRWLMRSPPAACYAAGPTGIGANKHGVGNQKFRRLHLRPSPDGHAARLAYYEARKLNNPPTSLLDYHDARRGLEPPAERRARERRHNGPQR